MKFSIRDLLLVTMIVALAVGWWVDRRRLESQLGEARQRIQLLDRDMAGFEKVVELIPAAPAPNPPKP